MSLEKAPTTAFSKNFSPRLCLTSSCLVSYSLYRLLYYVAELLCKVVDISICLHLGKWQICIFKVLMTQVISTLHETMVENTHRSLLVALCSNISIIFLPSKQTGHANVLVNKIITHLKSPNKNTKYSCIAYGQTVTSIPFVWYGVVTVPRELKEIASKRLHVGQRKYTRRLTIVSCRTYTTGSRVGNKLWFEPMARHEFESRL